MSESKHSRTRSARSERARDAAEEVCRAMRRNIANKGFVTTTAVEYLFRWMRLKGADKYDDPKPLKAKRKERDE